MAKPCEGTLYGVGVGPGDPELMTLRAHRLIASARVVAWPASADGESLARTIAGGFLRAGIVEIPVPLPMRGQARARDAAYDAAASLIGAHLAQGRDVVMLCEGDPLFYGSFMYVHERLRGRYCVEIVPGVSSLVACAARAGFPLCAHDERFLVLPALLSRDSLRRALEEADGVAIMKIGRHMPKIRRMLGEADLAARAVYVANATRADEVIVPLTQAPEVAPYFSMILVKSSKERR